MKNELLGCQAKDVITGFKGTIVGFCQYLTGCDQYCIQPKLINGTIPDSRWFDENRLSIKPDKKIILNNTTFIKGADISAPKI